ncbi:hypothetical protein XH81_30325 [Bradyrhizobium sp. CCBAU 25360]|nr:hypothetical protein [Bradyrhizobium sp. CCBAU 25360]
MHVTDRDTGKQYYLDMTPELKADLAAYHGGHCEHSSSEVRQRRDGEGAMHFYCQCLTCGKSIGSALRKVPELPRRHLGKTTLKTRFTARAVMNIAT